MKPLRVRACASRQQFLSRRVESASKTVVVIIGRCRPAGTEVLLYVSSFGSLAYKTDYLPIPTDVSDARCSVMAVKSDGGDDGGDYYDREGPARVSNTTTSASLRTLLPASLLPICELPPTYKTSSQTGSSQGENDETAAARATAATTAATTTISTSLFAVAALCLFLSCFLGSLQSPVYFLLNPTQL